MQLHQSLYRSAVEASVIVISLAPAERLSRWVTHVLDHELAPELRAGTRFIPNPGLEIYRAYGLGRNAWMKVFGPRILLAYALRFLRGKRMPRITEDPLQRGGDFVVDAGGRIALSHVGRDQADRLPVQDIIAKLS